MLEYSSNKLDNELLRYVGGKEKDHHPSYFSNKIFYIDIIKEFLKHNTNLDFSKNYFLEDNVIKFENMRAATVEKWGIKYNKDKKLYYSTLSK